MLYITDFADLAVLLPVALCVGAGLAVLGWMRGAVAWAVCVGGTLAALLGLKLAFLGCATPASTIFSPSGHTAAATMVLGGACALWLRRRIGPVAAAALAGGGVATVIGASRIALHTHSLPEVALGAAIGVTGLVAMLRWAGPVPDGLRGWRLMLVAAPLLLMLHGTRLGAETRLRHAAGWLPHRVCAPLAF
jgi:membrane-associated phospholipid phosphatase